MPDRFRARSGFRRIPGRARRYYDVKRRQEISRSEYIKRTEGYSHPKEKAKVLAKRRLETGESQPMTRYNAIKRQYKLKNPGAKIKGNSEFKKLYADLKKPRPKTTRGRLAHLKVLVKLGVINDGQYERYEANEGD